MFICKRQTDLQRSSDYVEDLGRDLLLAALVVGQRKFLEKCLGVVRGGLHRHCAGGVLGGGGVQKSRVDLEAGHLREEVGQQLPGGWFQNEISWSGGFLSGGLRRGLGGGVHCEREVGLPHRRLGGRGLEVVVDQFDPVETA